MRVGPLSLLPCVGVGRLPCPPGRPLRLPGGGWPQDLPSPDTQVSTRQCVHRASQRVHMMGSACTQDGLACTQGWSACTHDGVGVYTGRVGLYTGPISMYTEPPCPRHGKGAWSRKPLRLSEQLTQRCVPEGLGRLVGGQAPSGSGGMRSGGLPPWVLDTSRFLLTRHGRVTTPRAQAAGGAQGSPVGTCPSLLQ